MPVTLTLAGIAGFILSIGMAVDANILIFERMREELRWGRDVGPAVRAGFDRAWTSIRDSNSSTLITCLILYWFGQHFGASLITGFALTLAIGVIISLFSAIFVTRGLLTAVMSSRLVHNPALFGMEVAGRPGCRAQRSTALRAEGGLGHDVRFRSSAILVLCAVDGPDHPGADLAGRSRADFGRASTSPAARS